jgi:hypothetical protein
VFWIKLHIRLNKERDQCRRTERHKKINEEAEQESKRERKTEKERNIEKEKDEL